MMKEPIAVVPKPYLLLLSAILGALIGAGITLYNANATRASREFADTPEFLIWVLLISSQTAFFAVVVGPLLKILKQLKSYFAGNRVEIALATIMAMVLFWFPTFLTEYFSQPRVSYPLAAHQFKLRIIVGLAFVIALLAIAGTWLIYVALMTTCARIEPQEEYIQQYLRLREYLQWFLLILGTMIGLGTLATGALRQALIAVSATTPTEYPSIFVLTYGAYFTVMLILVYFPIYSSFAAIGRKLQDAFFPLPSPSSDKWTDIYSKRKKLEELLQLQTTAGQHFRENIAILTPLLSGILSILLA